MPAERYFIDSDLNSEEMQELKGTEFHHFAHVMRTKKGESVELVNGKGTLAEATVQTITKQQAFLKVEKRVQEQDHSVRMILAQAITKPNRLDFILEKGTELGVDQFWLFPGELSVKKEFFPHQLERARLLTIASMKQCGRLILPTIELRASLDQWPSLSQFSPYFGDLEPHARLLEEALRVDHPTKPIVFITGPESGFSDREVEFLKKMGVQGVKLHGNILRTDTASLVALSLISHWHLSHQKK